MDIDLNCDLGEGAGNDAAIIPLITSANVACGFHAGSPFEAWNTIVLASKHRVAIGTHPGHDDPEHFGRREMEIGAPRVFLECVYQIGAMKALAAAEGIVIKYIKPHGGLYHQANRDNEYAAAVVKAAILFDLPIMGLPGSQLAARARDRIPFIAEGFADRRYRPDGTLVPRDQPNAFIDDPAEAVVQVDWLIRERGVRTICVHGDNPKAIEFVKALRQALEQIGHSLRPFA
jgi:5-oxoprolinase (ATP-hydrolysing) subunit A